MFFLSQWVWQGHLAGEQAVLLNSCGHNKKLCVGCIKAFSSTLEEMVVAVEWLQSALVSPSIHLGFLVLALGNGYCSEFLCCCVALLGRQKCSKGKTKYFGVFFKCVFIYTKILMDVNKLSLEMLLVVN